MDFQRVFKYLIPFFLAIGLGSFLIWYFVDIFTYILISLVLAAILKTPTNYLAQVNILGVRLPRSLAVLTSFLLLIGLLSLFVYMFVPLISDQLSILTNIDVSKVIDRIKSPIHDFERFFLKLGLMGDQDRLVRDEGFSNLKNFFEEYSFAVLVNNFLSITGNLFVGLLAVLFITFFFLYERGTIRKYFISLIPNRYFEVSIVAISKTERLLTNYLFGLFLQMLAIFSIVAFGMIVMKIEYALTIALFAAVINLIPFLGPLLGGAFGLFVGLSTTPGIADTPVLIVVVAKIVSVFIVVQLTDNLILQPLIFSKSVKAHPLEIFLIIFVGANIAGAIGMIMAIPFYTMIKVMMVELIEGFKKYQVFRN